jgi:hypothetical protein
MLPIDTNLLRAVTKYDPAGHLRPCHTAPAARRPSRMWRFLVVEITRAFRLLRQLSAGFRGEFASKVVKPT